MKLQQYLSREKLKPSPFAARLGVPASTIIRLLKGEREPGLELALKIEDKTGGDVTAREVMEGYHEARAA